MCIIFYACNKKDSGNSNSNQHTYTFPKVSYALHTKLGNQDFNHSHFAIANDTTLINGVLYWDSSTTPRLFYPCQADKRSQFFRFDLYDSASLGGYGTVSSNISFSLPSINSFTNHYDTTVYMDIGDTTYAGYASVSVDITGVDNNKYKEPPSTMSGTFNMSGTILYGHSTNGVNSFSLDSIPFSSSGTFTNMPYFQPPQ